MSFPQNQPLWSAGRCLPGLCLRLSLLRRLSCRTSGGILLVIAFSHAARAAQRSLLLQQQA